ncbi:MAG: pitrilysin family protein [Xanthomonadales bacterium]|nr:pitrilysin family protein [Xanthomonadales bacterium]
MVNTPNISSGKTAGFVLAVALLFGASPGTSLWAQEKVRQSPPEGGTPKDFILPTKQHYQLPNGLKVTLVPYGSIPKVTISAIVMAGNLNEGKDTWLADLTASLMEEGTSSRSAQNVAREAAEMGGSLSIGVGLDQTFVTGQSLAEFAPDMVALLADVMLHPALPADELERLRRDSLRNLEVALNDPDTMALVAFREALYGDHPYGRLFPSAEQLQSYTVEQIRTFWDENFGAQRTHVFVAGMFDSTAVSAAIEQAFGGWKSGPGPLLMPPQPAKDRQYVDLINRNNASQSNVYLGLVTPDPSQLDYVALQAANSMLGGAFSSRITRNIREDKGYTYSPNSALSARKQDAYWVQNAAIATDDTAAALKEVYSEINRLRDEPPSEQELLATQNLMAGIFTLQNSTPQGIINVLNYVDLHGLGDDYLSDYVSRVYALTPAEISRVTQEYLKPDEMTLVVVGDGARIGEQLVPYLEPAP